MTAGEPEANIPVAVMRKRRSPSMIWIVPIVAALVGGWIWIDALRNMGPTITLQFADAEGLKAGKTEVKFKNVQVGTVDSIAINNNRSGVIVEVSLKKSMERHLGKESLFWVVRPRIEAEGISGLTTLLSGPYIAVKPEDSATDSNSGDPMPSLEFMGLDRPPVERGDLPGLELVLQGYELATIYEGAPLRYHGLDAGLVRSFELSPDGHSVSIDVWIKQPFVRHVRDNTYFWLRPLIDFSASADGIDFSVGSLRTLLSGGISFGLPLDQEPGEPSRSGDEFILHESLEATSDVFTNSETFVLFFDEPVRGLRVDAPVEFAGIKVGRVLSFRLEYDAEREAFFVPVFVEIAARRIRGHGDLNPDGQLVMQELMSRGLRARLETGTFLTGAKYIDLVLLPEEPAMLKGFLTEVMEVPTVTSTFASLIDIARSMADVGETSRQLIESIRLTSEQLRHEIESVDLGTIQTDTERFVAKLNELTDKFDAEFDPTLGRINAFSERGREVLDTIDALLGDLSQLTASDSKLTWLVTETLQELAASARSLRVLTDYLEQHPEALLKGKPGSGGD